MAMQLVDVCIDNPLPTFYLVRSRLAWFMIPLCQWLLADGCLLVVVSTTFDGSRQSICLSPVLACLSKNGDNVGVARHVADMSPTYPTKLTVGLSFVQKGFARLGAIGGVWQLGGDDVIIIGLRLACLIVAGIVAAKAVRQMMACTVLIHCIRHKNPRQLQFTSKPNPRMHRQRALSTVLLYSSCNFLAGLKLLDKQINLEWTTLHLLT